MLRALCSKLMAKLKAQSEYSGMYTYSDIAGKYYWIYGAWEAWNIKIVLKLFYKDFWKKKVFCDIGSNLGVYTVNLAQHFKSVEAFEPAPIASKILEANVLSNDLGNVTVNKIGLGSQRESSEILYDPKNSGMASVVQGQHSGNTKSQQIEIYSFDEFIKDKYVPNDLAFVKIDVEGFELQILKGMKDTLMSGDVVLQFEVDLNDSQSEEILKLLRSYGYTSFYTRPYTLIKRLMRRCFIQDIGIIPLDINDKRFYQAVWATK